MNIVSISGNLGKDVNYKILNKTTCSEVSLAVKDDYNKDKVHWFKIKAFGKVADLMNDYLSKGDKVLFQGSISVNSWKDKNDNYKENVEIIVNKFEIMNSKSKFATEDIPF